MPKFEIRGCKSTMWTAVVEAVDSEEAQETVYDDDVEVEEDPYVEWDVLDVKEL